MIKYRIYIPAHSVVRLPVLAPKHQQHPWKERKKHSNCGDFGMNKATMMNF